MSRYAFTYEADGKCEVYLESTLEEDSLDVIPSDDPTMDYVATQWVGNGWLKFWWRCMEAVQEYGRRHVTAPAYERCHAYDRWYDLERSW